MITAYQLTRAIINGLKGDTMKVITIANQKGGVGKTTTANVLIAGLTEKGYRVLGIDIDPQHNLSATMGAIDPKGSTILGVLIGEVSIRDAIIHAPTGDLIPSTMMLSRADKILADELGREALLKEALAELAGDYDFIVIDTPPAINMLTINALTACDYVVVPVEPDGYSAQGLDQLVKTINELKKYFNPSLEVAGVLITKCDARANITQEASQLIETLAEKLGTKVFDTRIRYGKAKASEIQFKSEGLFKYAPRTNLAKDYRTWIDEFLSEKV